MGLFAGPTPWHLHGDATITFLFFSVSASVDLTWGDSTQATLPQQPVLPDLYAALQNPRKLERGAARRRDCGRDSARTRIRPTRRCGCIRWGRFR